MEIEKWKRRKGEGKKERSKKEVCGLKYSAIVSKTIVLVYSIS